MSAAKSLLFQKIDKCITQNHYFSMKIHGFSSLHPYRRSAIWPSNSLDKPATPCLIFDRGVDFWRPNARIFKCMQRNQIFFTELTNAYRKSTTPIKDPRSDPWILSTKQPLHFWSSIGVSIPGPPKANLSNVCSEIVIFSESWRMYYAKSLLFYENSWILKLAPLSRIPDLTLKFFWQNSHSMSNPG